MSARDIYLDAVERKLDLGGAYRAAWPVGDEITIGQIGRDAEGSIVIAGHLTDDDRRITFERDDSDRKPDGYSYLTAGAVNVSAKVKGRTDQSFSWIAKADAGLKFEFNRANAVALRATDVIKSRIARERELARQMLAAWHDDQRMETGDIVITEVLQAASGFVAVSGSAGAKVEVTTEVEVGSGAVEIGKVTGLIKTAGESKTDLAVTLPNGFTLAYRALELDERGWFIKRPMILRRTIAEPHEYVVTVDDLNQTS